MATGIYWILNKVTLRYYVGSAVNIASRWGTHLSELRGDKHGNILLQRAWDKYGEDKFEFAVLVECEVDELLPLEQAYIDDLDATNPSKGFNINPTAGSMLGRTWRLKLTDEQRAVRAERMRVMTDGIRKDEKGLAKMKETGRNALKSPEARAKHRRAVILSRLNSGDVTAKVLKAMAQHQKHPGKEGF